MTMKTRGFIAIASFIIGNMLAQNALSVNLIDVYKQALSSDPTFKAARAQWLAERETLSIKRAALFPQLGSQNSISRAYSASSSGAYMGSYGNTSSYSLNLTQPLFHFGDWANVWQAQALVKKAEVTFLAAAEDLLLRTAKAYFNVLQAKDLLSFTTADREAFERTLNQTRHKYAVGLIAITDLENAKASYDDAVAKEIVAINDLAVSFEKLSEITGIRYISLDPVKEKFPLLSPQPADIEKWAKAAEQQNFDLAAKRYATIMAKENIKIQTAGHLPTIDATGSYGMNFNGNPNSSSSGHQKSASTGLSLNLPIFQGGLVLANVRQANYQYQKAISDQETTHRSTVSSTRQSYLTVMSNISQIRARKQAIISAQSSLHATTAGYEAGTRTMVEVLQEQAKLYERQKDYAVSEYTYLTQLLTLKQLTGILDVNDLAQINSWLEKPKSEKPQTNSNVSKKKNKPTKQQVITAIKIKKNTDQTEAIKKTNVIDKTAEKNAAKPPIKQTTTNTGTGANIQTSETPVTKPVIEQPAAIIPGQPTTSNDMKSTISAPATNAGANKVADTLPQATTESNKLAQATITNSTNGTTTMTQIGSANANASTVPINNIANTTQVKSANTPPVTG